MVIPVSAYIQAALFVLVNAVALFAAAGTIEIAGFWVYVAIFAAMMVASFAFLDPGLLRERMRPGGQRPPLALHVFALVLVLHWIIAGLDRGRFHWSDDAGLAPRCRPHCGRSRLRAGDVGHAGQSVLLVGGFKSRPIKPDSHKTYYGISQYEALSQGLPVTAIVIPS